MTDDRALARLRDALPTGWSLITGWNPLGRGHWWVEVRKTWDQRTSPYLSHDGDTIAEAVDKIFAVMPRPHDIHMERSDEGRPYVTNCDCQLAATLDVSHKSVTLLPRHYVEDAEALAQMFYDRGGKPGLNELMIRQFKVKT